LSPRSHRNWVPQLSLTPTWLVVACAYIGTVLWTIRISFSSSKVFPSNDFVGFAQYQRLFTTARWIISIENMFIFGALFIVSCLIIGFLLAVFLDQGIRGEGVFRTVFLYPYAMSFIVTGLAWQWILNPSLGIQQTVRNWGWDNFTFDWLVRGETAIYVIAFAGVWQSSGLVMAILLAGLRGIDGDLRNASKVDGIPSWRFYWSVVIPILRPMFATATILLTISVVKVFDLVVAMTGGGPGVSSEVPAKFVIEYLGLRQNIGLATAASSVMFFAVLIILGPWLYFQYFHKAKRGAA
jgi:glucose/mannose transport system permease protein